MTALTAARVKALTKPGMHNDGRGLYLRVAPGGSKGWMLRATIDGRRRDLGLGGYPGANSMKLTCLEREKMAEVGELNRSQQRLVQKTDEPGTDHRAHVWVLVCESPSDKHAGVCCHQYGEGQGH